MIPQSPRAKTEGWIASCVGDGVVESLDAFSDVEGMSLMRRWSSVIIEPDLGSFFTIHLISLLGTDGDEEDDEEGK